MPTPTEVEFYKAIESRQKAAFSALGLLRVMIEWSPSQSKHMEQAREIVAQADAADKVLAES